MDLDLEESVESFRIEVRDFLAAKRRSETEPLLPTGTRIAFTAGPAYQDHNRIWAVLDKVLAKYPDMVLFHGGNPTGGAVVWYMTYQGRLMITCFVPADGS